MIDMFKDLWDAMTPDQQKGISWIATNGTKTIGDTDRDDLMELAIAAINSVAKQRSDNYEDYREQVIAMCQGIGTGLLDGGIDYYVRGPDVL